MTHPRILLIGKTGQVAWELRHALAPLAEIKNLGLPELNLADPDAIRRSVRSTQPQVVVNAAAYTAVDKAESEADLAMKINGVAPGVLAEEAKRLGALLVHYSTDYVFGGTNSVPYLETDTPKPLGVYGRTKLAGEHAIEAVGGAHLVFRLSWVYGARGRNFLITILRLAAERKSLRVVNDQIGCPTWSRMAAQGTALALARILATGDRAASSGLYHMAASAATNWHEFAEAIVKRMRRETRKCESVEAITTAEYPTAARRPAYSVLNCDKLERTFGLRLPHWRESLNELLADPYFKFSSV
jgi:dTDP-4-dehydrorhamnose reductase